MAVAVNNWAIGAGNGTTASASISVSGADRCLWIGLKVLGGHAVTSPQIDGFALTPVFTDAANDIYSYLYIAPATGTRTIQMTIASATDWCVLVTSLTGVHQSSPIGTPLMGANSELTAVSQAVTGVANGLVMDFAWMVRDVIVPGAGQTRYPTSAPQGDSFTSGQYSCGMSSKTGTGSVTMSWSADMSFGDNFCIAVPFLPAAGGGGGGSGTNQNFLLLGIG